MPNSNVELHLLSTYNLLSATDCGTCHLQMHVRITVILLSYQLLIINGHLLTEQLSSSLLHTQACNPLPHMHMHAHAA